METCTLTLTGPSALAVIRASRLPGGPALVPADDTVVPEPPRTKVAIQALLAALPILSALLEKGEPVHVRVPSSRLRVRSRSVRCHVTPGTFPAGSFWEACVSQGPTPTSPTDAAGPLRVLVDAPSLALLRRAELLCRQARTGSGEPGAFEVRIRLLADELELCGCYGRDPLEPSGPACTYKLPPVGTAADLRQLAASEFAGNCNGRPRHARQPLRGRGWVSLTP